jgi:hypothetical protein
MGLARFLRIYTVRMGLISAMAFEVLAYVLLSLAKSLSFSDGKQHRHIY